MLDLFVDADACPVKQEIYKVADRYALQVILVANRWMRTPVHSRIRLEVVTDGFDAADNWIVDHVAPQDIVVTADIVLAGRCLEKGALVLGSDGKPFTEANIGDAIAMRDLLADLRGPGEQMGGPAPMTQKVRSRFLQKLDEMIQQIRRSNPS